MTSRWPDYPALKAEHLRDARLFANRTDLISSLPVPRGGKVAEIGVWQGVFSKVIIEKLQPGSFYAFDIFTGHTYEDWNGLTGRQLFDGLTQRQFYERAMTPFRNVTTVVEGPSQQTLRKFTDRSFDLVYVDGDHDYEAVKVDAVLAADMTAPRGYLVFNDYIMLDQKHAAYGVVPAVNDLVVNDGWRVIGYALDKGLHCDIALAR